MAEETAWDKEAIEDIANKIGGLLDEMKPFDDLKPFWPPAGNFGTATWLEQVVDDRRNGVVAHANHLKDVFEELRKKLKDVARELEDTDKLSADRMNELFDDLRTSATGKIDNWETSTEESQANFHGEDEDTRNGYSNNINNPLPAT